MLSIILTSALAFISTNVDDIFLLTLFFAQCRTLRSRLQVVAGQYLGIGVLTALSLLGACGFKLLPPAYLGLLGLVPITLGAKELVGSFRSRSEAESEEETSSSFGLLRVAAVTIAGGGDNLGVYIPLFSRFSARQLFYTTLIFALFTALWCFLAASLARLPRLQRGLRAYKHILVPLVLILLGISILIDAYGI